MILRSWRFPAALSLSLLLASGLSAGADQLPGAARGAAAVPFLPGERSEYQVKLAGIGVGHGSMEVLGVEEVQGRPTYHTRLRVAGGIPFARVDDRLESWIDVEGLFSRRFRQDQKEVRFRRYRTYDFYPEARTYRRVDNGEVGSLPTDQPLDEVSFLFYARTLPLNPGDVYRIPRYFKADGNPVVLKVLRRETIRVPAGTFRTVVVEPEIQTDGLFGKGGHAELYFSDDSRRIMVMMRSRVPVVGSLSLHLQSYTPGSPQGAVRP